MGFFVTFWTWLNGQLTGYIGDSTRRLSVALEPAIVTMGTLYIMAWGYLQMTGRIEEPFVFGLKRILTVAVVLGVSLRLWLYNAVIVDLFYQGPIQLGAAVIGAPAPAVTDTPGSVYIIDTIWERGGAAAGYLWNNGGVFRGDFGFYIAAVIVWVLIGLLCVYTMFLIALSRLALSVLLALGPFFVAMLLFESTKRLFDAWLAQLANYGLVAILTTMGAALLLQLVESYATQTAALGTALATVDVLNMVLVSVLAFLFMRQVMPIASALAGGAAFNTFGTVSRALNWSARTGMRVVRVSAKTAVAVLRRERD
jgi:type IV secretion system protein VirB6